MEEFVRPIEKGLAYDEDELFEVSRRGVENILGLLKEKNVKSTFFVTHVFAMRHKELVKKLVRDGHELALHAYSHDDPYSEMEDKETYRLLEKAKSGLERTFGVVVKGFRSPQLQFVSKNVLKKLGVVYDSSFHPTWVPGKYFHLFGKREVFRKNGLTVVPISVAWGLRLPFSWIWFRVFGLDYAKFCTLMVNNKFINIYFHPWDFVDLSPYQKDIGWLYVRNSGQKMVKDMGKYIDFCKSRGFVPSTIVGFIENESK